MVKTLIFKTPEEVCLQAAHQVAKRIRSFEPTPQKPFLVLGLPTGGTPKPMYQEWICMYRNEGLSFKNVVTFNMDEYCGLPLDHPESYHAFMYKNLFNHIDIPTEQIHILNGLASDKKAQCDTYEKMIKEIGGIDLQIGGIGSNGHIAFNEPKTPFKSRTHEVVLTEQTRRDNARFFENDLNQVPKSALTIGLGTIFDAREIMILATGSGKAEAIFKTLRGPITDQIPATVLREHPHAYFYCDADAAAKLK